MCDRTGNGRVMKGAIGLRAVRYDAWHSLAMKCARMAAWRRSNAGSLPETLGSKYGAEVGFDERPEDGYPLLFDVVVHGE